MTKPAKHISITINRSASEVYAYAADPENLPKWAAGLSSAMTKEGDHWTAMSPVGKVKVRFSEHNSYGILDHDVTLDSGNVIHVPLRVLKNDEGSEVVFTLFREADMSEDDVARYARMVTQDLAALKEIMETVL